MYHYPQGPDQCIESSTTSNSWKTSDHNYYTTTLSSKRRQDRFTPAITNAFAPDDRIIHNGPHSLTLLNLKSLEPALSSGELATLKALDTDFRQGQLYDEIINSYFWLFSKRHPEIMYAPNTSMTALMSGSSCRLLWKDEHIEGKQYIFLPWNPTGDHWVLWVVDFARQKFMYLDPLRNDQDPARYPRYVIAAFQKLSALMFVKFNLSNTEVEYPFKCLQRDSISCGVMVCFYGHQIIMKKPLTEEMNTVLFRRSIFETLMDNCHPRAKRDQDICQCCKGEATHKDWIQCSRCRQSFHCECVGLTPEESYLLELYYCP